MTTYSITVILDPKWVRQFRNGKMNLCTSFSITSNYSKVAYNVIATHEDPVPLNTVSWNDDYRIAACKTGFSDGAYVVPSVYPLPIKFGEGVSLLKDWTMETPNPNDDAPSNGWLFSNTPSASALLFKTIRNRPTPIYVTSASAPPPPGQHTLIPNGRIMIFFCDAEARTTFRPEFTNTSSYEYSYLEHPHVTVCFNQEGRWEMISESSSDAVASGALGIIAQHRDKPKL